MGVTAVAIVVVCAALYTVFELIERRKQRNFEEQLRDRKSTRLNSSHPSSSRMPSSA